MAKRLSTGMVNYLSQEGGIAQALSGGVIDFYTGSQPTLPDDAPAVGTTHLCRFTLAGASYTQETRAAAKLAIGGTTGKILTIKVAGIDLMSGEVANTGATATTVTAVVDNINAKRSYPEFKAVAAGGTLDGVVYGSSGDVGTTFYIVAPKNSGDVYNGTTLAWTCDSATTINLNGAGAAEDGSGNFATGGTGSIVGINAAGGLNFINPNASAGILVKESTAWQGTATASGTVGWFRFSGNNGTSSANPPATAPTGPVAASPTSIRFDGTVGTSGSGADMIVSSTTISAGAVQTINTFTINTSTSQS